MRGTGGCSSGDFGWDDLHVGSLVVLVVVGLEVGGLRPGHELQ